MDVPLSEPGMLMSVAVFSADNSYPITGRVPSRLGGRSCIAVISYGWSIFTSFSFANVTMVLFIVALLSLSLKGLCFCS